MNRRGFLVLAALLAAVAVLLAVSGGVRATVGGLRISARSPLPAAAFAVAAAGAWWLLARRAKSITSDLDDAWSAIEQRSAWLVAAAAITGGVVSAVFATNSAAGADASGYLSEAAQWASGRLYYQEPLAGIIAAFDPWLTTPLGWRPGPFPGWQSPTYPPGLPLLMALPYTFGGTAAAALVVTLASALAVWATGTIASRLAGGAAGIIAALALATSPVFLYQSVQPMSDVPVSAAWMLTWALLLRRGDKPLGLSFIAGIACAIAVLIRPNLAPLAAVPLYAIGWNRQRLIAFSTPVAIAGVGLMWLQWQWYGSPLRSGYGAADELFALANAAENAGRYFSWLVATSPLLLVAPIGVVLLRRERFTQALAAFAALVVAAYLVYAVFDVWSYLRFLLPAMAVAAMFTGVAFAAALKRLPASWRAMALLALGLGVVAHGVSGARSRDAFRLADQQRRVSQVGDHLASTLPADAVIVSGEQSGSLRYYTGRSILRWDLATAGDLAVALEKVAADGRVVAVALDAWEHEPFRARHGGIPAVTLEWPPAFEAGTSHRTRVWRLSDREAFLRGERVATERVP